MSKGTVVFNAFRYSELTCSPGHVVEHARAIHNKAGTAGDSSRLYRCRPRGGRRNIDVGHFGPDAARPRAPSRQRRTLNTKNTVARLGHIIGLLVFIGIVRYEPSPLCAEEEAQRGGTTTNIPNGPIRASKPHPSCRIPQRPTRHLSSSQRRASPWNSNRSSDSGRRFAARVFGRLLPPPRRRRARRCAQSCSAMRSSATMTSSPLSTV